MTDSTKPRIAVHKFSSCDGCQLAFLNAGEALLQLAELVDIVHFAEAGPVQPDARVDIAFVEGSISTPEERERIATVRANSRFLVTLGACATSGGLQALRSFADVDDWSAAVYAQPTYIHSLAEASPIADHVKVDLALWGCPVNGQQVLAAVASLLQGVPPVDDRGKVCMQCKREQAVCVMVAKGLPCMGPVTRTGCGALCPRFGRDCYACFGPAENSNGVALGQRFEGLGLLSDDIRRRFLFISNGAPAFREAAAHWSEE